MKTTFKAWVVSLVAGLLLGLTACDGFGFTPEEDESTYWNLEVWGESPTGHITIPTDTMSNKEGAWYMVYRFLKDGTIMVYTQLEGVVYVEEYPYTYDESTRRLLIPKAEGKTGIVTDWVTAEGTVGIHLEFYNEGETEVCESMGFKPVEQNKFNAMIDSMSVVGLESGRSLHNKQAILGYWQMVYVENDKGSYATMNTNFSGFYFDANGILKSYQESLEKKELQVSTYENYMYDPKRKWFQRGDGWILEFVTMKPDSMSLQYTSVDWWQKVTYARISEEQFYDKTAGLTVVDKN